MKVAGLGVVSLRLQGIHLHMKRGIRDCGFVLLRHVQLTLLLEPRASVPLTQDLELGPVCGELLRETLLRRDGARHSGLLVLGAGRRLGRNLSPFVWLVEEVKLWKDEGARARAGGGGGGAPALAAALPPAPDCSAGRSNAGCSVQFSRTIKKHHHHHHSPAEVLRAGA
jgi:hypothetical protein